MPVHTGIYRKTASFAAVFLVFGFFCGAACAKERAVPAAAAYQKANVILIILDALRPERLGCYTPSQDTSPHIDALAQRGVVFTNAFSQSHLTLPSVTSLFTSLYPFVHQTRHIFRDSVPEQAYTLAEVLRLQGYQTAWFGYLRDPHSGSAPGLLKGFEEGVEIRPERIFQWIEQNGEKPFFIAVHSYATHEKDFIGNQFENKIFARIPKSFLQKVEDARVNGWQGFQSDLRNKREGLYDFLGKDWIEQNWDLLMEPYSAERYKELMYRAPQSQQKLYMLEAVTGGLEKAFASYGEEATQGFLGFLDSALFDFDQNYMAGLHALLEKKGLDQNTVIVITADHGNEFFEHGRLGHLGPLFDESIHIPLIFHLPGHQESVVINDLAQSIDIFPTLLDLLGVPIPSQVQGISLAGVMADSPGANRHDYVYGQSVGGLLYIRSRQWKLILPGESLCYGTDTGAQLFDLTRDPQEKINLIAKKTRVAAKLRKKLRDRFGLCNDKKLFARPGN
ncbi:MAG: sulfatase [Candidatus Omnitrophica bacterium]|nr:sulfatase [Candidatus Omnitrophota bacterium]